jgi:hypothetical protein
VFTLEAVCGETETKREKKMKKMWMHNLFVSKCTEGKFHMLFQRLRKVEVSTGLSPAQGLGLDVGSVQMIAMTSYIRHFQAVLSLQKKSDSGQPI